MSESKKKVLYSKTAPSKGDIIHSVFVKRKKKVNNNEQNGWRSRSSYRCGTPCTYRRVVVNARISHGRFGSACVILIRPQIRRGGFKVFNTRPTRCRGSSVETTPSFVSNRLGMGFGLNGSKTIGRRARVYCVANFGVRSNGLRVYNSTR